MTDENPAPAAEAAILAADADDASCCSREVRATCCDSGERSACCGVERTDSGGCGCR